MQEIYKKIKELVTQFNNNAAQYRSINYDESNTRVDFIDKFFELLGWDVSNRLGYAEQYRDVIREDKIKIDGKQKAPDYAFTTSGTRRFFVEAKKPSVNIKESADSAFQIRRYAYTAKLPLSILTDFEEFAVYDTRIKPNSNDSASVARIFYCTFDEYEKHWDFLNSTFSRTAILKGSFDRYAQENKNKKGTSLVDDELLHQIEEWRNQLAKNIALRNENVDIYNINTAVSRIIDRLIFLRIAEDKEIEHSEQLLNSSKQESVYKSLCGIFLSADAKYNAGLFRTEVWLQELHIDSKILKSIIEEMYYPKCPYEFSLLPIEILGNIYEQFLGKTIRLTAGHQAKVEEKSEVRKAGGVYYTPQYIVNYIVENTIGEKIKGKTPEEIAKLTVVDPACGSGSFLVGAYNYLLNYHAEYYSNKKNLKNSLKKSLIYQTGATYKLTIEEKQKILTNNIFGVDIDAQAVEVSKLSLYLKLLESEGKEAEGQLFKHSDFKLLPNLDNNIQCGNSLIASDFYAQKDLLLFEEPEMRKVNVFDWEKAFPAVFANGGFDVVIGNPPYVKEYTDKEIFENIKKSYLAKYYQGKMDLWYLFVCNGLDILKSNGKLGFIAPNNWITNSGASILRNKILTDSKMLKYVDFGDYKVFKDASIQTMIFVLSKENAEEYKLDYYKVLDKNVALIDLEKFLSEHKINEVISKNNITISKQKMHNNLITFVNDENETVLSKIKEKANYFFNEKEITNGIHHHHDYLDKNRQKILGNEFKVGDGIFVIKHHEKNQMNLSESELALIKPVYTTQQLDRYFADSNNKEWVIYTDSSFKSVATIKTYPNIKNHLDKFRKVITSDNAPYGLHRARKEDFFIGEKIISLRKCSKYPVFSFVNFDSYVSAAFYVIKPNDINLKYLTGILNSKLIAFWLKNKGKMQGVNYQVDKEPLLDIPILNTENKPHHDKLVSLVEQMLATQKQLHAAFSDADKKLYTQKCDILDKQIDAVVYELYGLSEEEIKVVEGK